MEKQNKKLQGNNKSLMNELLKLEKIWYCKQKFNNWRNAHKISLKSWTNKQIILCLHGMYKSKRF